MQPVYLLVPLLLSSRRLSPDPILSKSARAELNLSWWDSVRWTFTWLTENIVIHRLPLDIWTIFEETYLPLIIWNLILGRRKNRHFTARLTEERGLPPKPKHKHFMNIFDAFPFNFVEWHSFFLFFCHVKDCLSKTAPSFLTTPRHTWSRRCHIWRPVHYLAIPLFTPSRISFTSHSFLLYPTWLPNLIISGVF